MRRHRENASQAGDRGVRQTPARSEVALQTSVPSRPCRPETGREVQRRPCGRPGDRPGSGRIRRRDPAGHPGVLRSADKDCFRPSEATASTVGRSCRRPVLRGTWRIVQAAAGPAPFACHVKCDCGRLSSPCEHAAVNRRAFPGRICTNAPVLLAVKNASSYAVRPIEAQQTATADGRQTRRTQEQRR